MMLLSYDAAFVGMMLLSLLMISLVIVDDAAVNVAAVV